jgi:hypothetical protein
MSKRLVAISSLIVVWLGPHSMARANGFCGQMTPEQSANQVDVVFAGKVIAANEEAWRINRIRLERHPPFLHLTEDFDRARTTFEVTTVWKGSVNIRTSVIHNLLTADDSYSFRKGGEYIVYAKLAEGELHTSDCFRTNPLSAAKEDLTAFGPGKPPAPNPSSRIDLTRKLIVVFLLLLALGLVAWMARRRFGVRSHEQTNSIG